MDFKHGSLFSGIGGFDLAAEWMGWDNVFHCEWNEFGKKILNYYWPKAIAYHDITKTDFTIHRGAIDILTGGFPCQPYSQAGKRKGKDDERHLWPEMLRAIREIQPRWVVGENVLGLVNWNGGLVFDEVQADLEAEGYEVWPYVLPACAVNAPHRRDRVWFVAHSRSKRGQDEKYNAGELRQEKEQFGDSGTHGIIAHTDNINRRAQPQKRCCAPWAWNKFNRGPQNTVTYAGGIGSGKSVGWKQSEQFNPDGEAGRTDANTNNTGREKFDSPGFAAKPGFVTGQNIKNWSNWPTQSPVCNGDDGIPARLDFAAVFGSVKHPRQPARAFGKWRNESIKGGGNAIVPPLVYQIFQTVEAYENKINKNAVSIPPNRI